MGVKYRVCQDLNDNIKCYGHFTGKNATEAVKKAINAHKETTNFDFSIPFNVKRGRYDYVVNIEE